MNPSAHYVSADEIADLAALYDQGRYVAAHLLAVERHGPLPNWYGGSSALVFGARLAGNVGGDRLSHALILRARRQAATDLATTAFDRAQAALFHAYRTQGRRGPLALRRFLKRPGVCAAFAAGANADIRADVLCLHARVAAAYRDHDAAENAWQEAHALAVERPWTWTERAALLIQADQYPAALDAAREALRLSPWYRPAVQQAAQALTLLGSDDQAVALLEEALDAEKGRLESAAIAAQLAELCAALVRPEQVLGALDRFEAYSPLLEEQGRLWLASRRAEARLQLGDLAGAAAASEPLVGTSFFYEKTVSRLRDPERQTARRRLHDVPFIRQYERTCAPATLAALSHFWGQPADHAAIAREICYGGTFEHQERHWAETHGWTCAEFRADWPATVALLEAAIPFAVVTTAINSGHLQAVIGYDARRGTLIIRDPFERNHAEFLAEEFMARYAFCGPRALAIVPAADPATVERLQAISLPEAALYDGLYHFRRALHVHNRAAARVALDHLEALDPAARLTFFARRELGYYDGDDGAALAAVEGLLALFATDGRLRLEKLTLLRRLARTIEARAWLETCAADRAHTEPNLWRELARDLAADPRERPRARQLLARSLFYEPVEPEHVRFLAELRWGERDYAESAALFRLAATCAGTREDAWRQFFLASRHLRESEAALRLLNARFRRLGERSAQPAKTLYWALRERHEFAPAEAVLAEALACRPEDGDLLLFAATAKARNGEHALAAEYLQRAGGHAPPGACSRTAAELAGLSGNSTAALGHWREVLAREPLDAAAHEAVARLLAETDPRGAAAAREHLDAAVARFPHAIALHELRIRGLVDDPGRGTPEHAAAVAALLAAQPAHVWAWREKVLSREAFSDLPGALLMIQETERLDPFSPPTHALQGRLQLAAGNPAEARASLRRALELDADLPGVLSMLLESSPSVEEKRAALEFMHGLLVQQALVGDGILAYRTAAYPLLEETALTAQLEAFLAARPDLWQAWSAMAWQHADAARPDLARAKANAAVERFPFLPNVWLDLAGIERTRGDAQAELSALERALRLQLANGEASGRVAVTLGYLAAARLRLRQRTEAKGALREAMRRQPAYYYAPATLFKIQLEDKELRDAAETLLFLQKHHPGNATLCRTVILAAKRKEGHKAKAALSELVGTRPVPGADEGDLQSAVNAMIDEGFRPEAEAALLEAMSAPESGNLDVGALWVRSRAEQRQCWGLDKIVRRLPENELARRARIAYLSILTERRLRPRTLLFVWRMRRLLRADTHSWGQAGYALTGCGWHRNAVRWLSDWATRPELAGWMLFNLASSLRTLGRHNRALAINRQALTLPPDQTRLKHLAWVALEDALTDGEEARQRAAGFYAEIRPQIESQPEPYRTLDVLTDQVLAVRAVTERAQRAAVYQVARQTLRKQRYAGAAVLRAERRARRRLAYDAGKGFHWLIAWIVLLPSPVTWRVVWFIIWLGFTWASYHFF